MNYQIAVLVEDYSVLGGVEKVTANLLEAFLRYRLPTWGLVSLNSRNAKPVINYPDLPIMISNNKEQIAQQLLNNNVNIVIIQISWELGLFLDFSLFFQQKGIKVIGVLHNTPFLWTDNWNNISLDNVLRKFKFYINVFRHKKLMLKLASTCDKFLLLSENCQKEFELLTLNACAKKTQFMYNIIPKDKLSGDTIRIEEKKDWLVYAGRLAPMKRVFLTVQLLHPILERYPNWTYYILGDGEEFNCIRDYINKHHISNIKLMGIVDNVNDYLRQSKISILYSLYEGLPTALLEASLYRNVLICSESRGGVIDIVNASSGVIVPNHQAFVACMDRLLGDKTSLDDLLQSAIFDQKFNEEAIIAKWILLFNELMS